jgi:hypothetical protein
MDLTQILAQLYAQRDRVRQVIAILEQFQQEKNTAVLAHKKRGRKSMGTEERNVVAERMKTFWANKRQQESNSPEKTRDQPEREDSTCDGLPLNLGSANP